MFFKVEYSIKKAIALTFLMLVGVVIMAHAVIPHHHHNGISFISGAAQPEHDDEYENCLLLKVYARLSNDKQTFRLHDFDFDLLPCVLNFSSDVIRPQTIDAPCLTFGQKPYLHSNHTEFIARSAGLRAPPFQLRITN